MTNKTTTIEELNYFLVAWRKEKSSNTYGMADYADRAIKILEVEINSKKSEHLNP